jgi:glycolate oxidase FAD binding subunit
MRKLSGQNIPLSGLCYDGDHLRIRLAGAEAAIIGVQQKLGGEFMTLSEAEVFWFELREIKLAFFLDETPLWRLSLPSAAVQPDISGSWLIDWGGGLRWLKTNESAASIFSQASNLGGHACRFRSKEKCLFQPLSPGLTNLHQRIKAAFDPQGIFNPGRIYPGF